MDDTRTLSIDTDVSGSTGRVELAGEIDAHTSAGVVEAIRDLLRRPLQLVQVDLGGVGFIDSAGLRALVKLRQVVVEQGLEFSITATSPTVDRLFAITGLNEVLLPTERS